MCRGRHRAENRVGEVQARGVVRGGAGWGGGAMVRILPLGPGKCLVLCLVTSAICELYPLHREVHSEAYITPIYVQNMFNLRFLKV